MSGRRPVGKAPTYEVVYDYLDLQWLVSVPRGHQSLEWSVPTSSSPLSPRLVTILALAARQATQGRLQRLVHTYRLNMENY